MTSRKFAAKKKQIVAKKCQFRFIEIGWMNKEEDGYKQVRTINGGGTRKVCVPVHYKKQDLLLEVQKLFFSNGECAQGTLLKKFSTNMLDFSGNPISDYLTVEQMFLQTKLTRLKSAFINDKKSICESLVSGALENPTFDLIDAYDSLENTSLNDSSNLDVMITTKTIPPVEINPLLEKDFNSIFIYDYDQLDNIQNLLSLPSPNTSFADRLLAAQLQSKELSVNNLVKNSEVTNSDNTPETTITLHRGYVFEELIEVFSKKKKCYWKNSCEINITQQHRSS